MTMSSRLIRGDRRVPKLKGTSIPREAKLLSGSQEHVMDVEKQAFEQGYAEGERIGKEMGEKMVETIVKRYDNAISRLAETHKALAESMEEEIVRLALEISRKIVQRELAMDPDIVSAVAAVALKRVSNHQSITLRVSRQDFGRIRTAIATTNPAVQVKEDASLVRGDSVIDTAQTHLVSRIATHIQATGHLLSDDKSAYLF